ncbi:MAG: hypothetical protein GY861_12730 [bacterium]|nr:hypothetical protein [bacterium]
MAYSATTWAKVKADYESGNYSAPQLYEKYTISEIAIKKKIVDEKWEKGKNKEIIIQSIAEKNIELFAKLGMTQEKKAQMLINGTSDDNSIAIKFIQEINKMCGSHAPVKKETDLTSGGKKLELPQIYLPENGH